MARAGSAVNIICAVLAALWVVPTVVAAESGHHEHHRGHQHDHNMVLDRDGMVMNENTDELPRDCVSVTAEVEITVRVGRDWARTGQAYGFDQHEWRAPGCARITVTLVNDDAVRHQWMVHGLPRYLYPQGMFHLEAAGGRQRRGTFIVPSDATVYLVHCDIAQHMEKGLKAQLRVGGGRGNLPSVPGISGPRRADDYGARQPMRPPAALPTRSPIAYRTKNSGESAADEQN